METIIKPFQLGISAELIDNYKRNIPFSNYFSEQCKLHRNWGSKDRRIYRQACYAYFRLGFAMQDGSTESNIKFALQPVSEILNQIETKTIFPNYQLVSKNINFDDWVKSLLVQKPVYLAIVKDKLSEVKLFLEEHQILYDVINHNAIKVSPNSNCNELVEKGLAWIMDISSQNAAANIKIDDHNALWDCCSGAGGKALFLVNSNKQPFKLTCSDARFSVLENLKKRFISCHLPLPQIAICDLSTPNQLKDKYDIILADVPCSGSGTWGRTPENITNTDIEKIVFYAKLQRTIIDNARKNLKLGGKLYYITCSVFKEENELNIAYFEEYSGLKLIKEQYFNSNAEESDWLYCAELVKL